MSSVVDTLRARLAGNAGAEWCVAFSGGLDSTVLLFALHELSRELDGIQLRAVHVDHGLHANARAWAGQCEIAARQLGVPFEVCRVEVDLTAGDGIEAAARYARYAALEQLLEPGATLMTAHHADDQVETVLLRLLRGTGVRGLGSIAERMPFGPGWLVRPLLTIDRSELEAFARARSLTWVEDPTNLNTARDRNYLRHEVVPVLRRRWPGLPAALGRSARLAAEGATLLRELAEQDSVPVVRDGLIELDALRRLTSARQRNLVRYVLHERGLVPPSETQLLSGLAQLLSARVDRQPVLRWPGGQIRRYRERLYVLDADPGQATAQLPDEYAWDGCAPLDMGPVRGRLRLICDDPPGASAGDLVVRFRRGGERLAEADRRHHKRLKKVLQACGVLPWMRAHVPLVSRDGELLAVGDLWVGAPPAATSRIVWDRHARIR